MTKIDIISGFLGAGKTTLIKKLLKEAFDGEKIVLIENEFGEIGIDGTILKDYGIEIKEMNSGCICCSISGDFTLAIKELLMFYHPDRIIIEPSGVGKLSDVIKGCKKVIKEGTAHLNMCITVVDTLKYKTYCKNFAEFYENQLAHAKTIILSRTQYIKPEELKIVINNIKDINTNAHVVTTEWDNVNGNKIVEIGESIEELPGLNKLLEELGHAHVHQHEHGTHHHADDVFRVWGTETVKIFKRNKLKEMLNKLDHIDGNILRAKGIIKTEDDKWIQFDYVPHEVVIRDTTPDCIGRLCVIGNNVDSNVLSSIFEL